MRGASTHQVAAVALKKRQAAHKILPYSSIPTWYPVEKAIGESGGAAGLPLHFLDNPSDPPSSKQNLALDYDSTGRPEWPHGLHACSRP